MTVPASSSCILALNAAEGRLQFVIAGKENSPGDAAKGLAILCAQDWHAPSQGAELLVPTLRDALDRLKLRPVDIGAIACVRGPGSFTGLRLVLATAAGLARATGALQAGLDYMRLLADSAFERTRVFRPALGMIWALTHARRQLIHVQGFRLAPEPLPTTKVLVLPPEEAARLIALEHAKTANSGETLLLGSGLTRNRALLEEALQVSQKKGLELLPPAFDHPDTPALVRAAANAEYSSADIAPLYVRPSDAEENLESIALSLGLDPQKARWKLARLTGVAPEDKEEEM